MAETVSVTSGSELGTLRYSLRNAMRSLSIAVNVDEDVIEGHHRLSEPAEW